VFGPGLELQAWSAFIIAHRSMVIRRKVDGEKQECFNSPQSFMDARMIDHT